MRTTVDQILEEQAECTGKAHAATTQRIDTAALRREAADRSRSSAPVVLVEPLLQRAARFFGLGGPLRPPAP